MERVNSAAQPARSQYRKHDRESFFKYVSADVATIILQSRRLRWSSPLLFNDPLDVTQELRLQFTEAELYTAFVDHVAGLVETGVTPEGSMPFINYVMATAARLPVEARRAIAQELRASTGQPTSKMIDAFGMVRLMWRDMVPSFRILCLSEQPAVMPMWAHYADKSRGCVLELAALDATDSALLMAKKVRYQDDPPTIATAEAWVRCLATGRTDVYWPMFEQNLYVKGTEWSYEREWRVVSPGSRKGEGGGLFGDLSFDARELKAVYLGPRATDAARAEVLSLLVGEFEHVRAYTSALHRTLPTLEFRPIK